MTDPIRTALETIYELACHDYPDRERIRLAVDDALNLLAASPGAGTTPPALCEVDGAELSVLDWARERFANTFDIAASKHGDDRASWLEDAAYWKEIVKRLESVGVDPADLERKYQRACQRWGNLKARIKGEIEDLKRFTHPQQQSQYANGIARLNWVLDEMAKSPDVLAEAVPGADPPASPLPPPTGWQPPQRMRSYAKPCGCVYIYDADHDHEQRVTACEKHAPPPRSPSRDGE